VQVSRWADLSLTPQGFLDRLIQAVFLWAPILIQVIHPRRPKLERLLTYWSNSNKSLHCLSCLQLALFILILLPLIENDAHIMLISILVCIYTAPLLIL
jgi:hypothetical protein